MAGIAQWLKNSKNGWQWLAVILPLQIISALTNIAGLLLALPLPAAILMGIGVQLIALYAGVKLINAPEDRRAGWKGLLVPVIALSVFFSFAGFTSYYQDRVEADSRPLKLREDLKRQALDLASGVDEGRRLAMSKLENRIVFARDTIARIRRKLNEGLYSDPSAGVATTAELQSRIDDATKHQEAWRTFSFSPQAAIAAPNPDQGFAILQAAHADLGRMMGVIREAKTEFTMPATPVPSIDMAEGAKRKDLVSHTFSQVGSFSGLFWLLVALMLELIPFWAAHANPSSHGEEDGASEGQADGVLTPSGHPAGVAALVEADKAIAQEVSDFNARLRPVHFIAASTMQDVEEQSARLDNVVDEYRKAHVEAVRLESLEKIVRVRVQQMEMMAAAAEAFGKSRQEIERMKAEKWEEVMKEFGVEDIRLEHLREERRGQAIQPSPEASW